MDCPLCGGPVKVYTADEGTSSYMSEDLHLRAELMVMRSRYRNLKEKYKDMMLRLILTEELLHPDTK